jgi:tetratricopeptide (TPR) repeat protein
MRRAAQLDQAGQCAEAEQIYLRALARPSPSPALLNNAGNHYLACGRPDKARIHFARLLRLNPRHVNAGIQMARLEMAAREFQAARDRLQRLAATLPGDAEILVLLGQAQARTGDARTARDTLEAALRLRPDHPAATLEAGLANAAAGDSPRAVFLLARAHAQSPRAPAIALALARAAEDAGYFGDAVVAYDRYLQLAPADAGARRDRARALAHTPRGRDAGILELERHIASHPRDADGHFYLAQLVWEKEEERALSLLRQATALHPGHAPAHVARAWLLHRMGRTEEAVPHLREALRVAPNDIRALDQLGVSLLALNQHSEAEAALRKAAALAPGDAEVALHLGRALVEQGREAEGEQWLAAYQKLRPARQRHARREPGMIELATLDPAGRRAREIDRFRSMAAARPDDPVLQLHLAELLLSDGRAAEAIRAYRALLSLNGDREIWKQAGQTLLDAGEPELAVAFLERSGASAALANARLRIGAAATALAGLDAVAPEQRDGAYWMARARTLDALGQPAPAAQAVAGALAAGGASPDLTREAGLLLAKYGRLQESLDVLRRGRAASPADRELQLAEAMVLLLRGDRTQAEATLRRIQSTWPEWDRPWLVHAMLLTESGRTAEAAARLRTAQALGARDGAGSCTVFRDWLFGTCRKQ